MLCCCREDGRLVGDEAFRHICRGKTTSGDDEAAGLVLGLICPELSRQLIYG
jgi:hypothetical protein